MPSMKHNPGIIISGICHILILAIPVSFAVVQKYKEVHVCNKGRKTINTEAYCSKRKIRQKR